MEKKARLARGAVMLAVWPVIIYLELREKFEHTDWKW